MDSVRCRPIYSLARSPLTLSPLSRLLSAQSADRCSRLDFLPGNLCGQASEHWARGCAVRLDRNPDSCRDGLRAGSSRDHRRSRQRRAREVGDLDRSRGFF